ncbi:hypothetical protein ARMSODRAFT_1006818 [Armillaria solidipes]|uniref:F-box domain-containing protein n=1 Tax=Armillaria solidipes TaxID=1076256 RepID=A0A2H3BD07_9AGAR|nr:hypothetical protein ARMSODRAFT_1006818 [Armillaria solidipes]
MSKKRRGAPDLRSRLGVTTRTRRDLIALLPQELVDLIVDRLQHDFALLHACSLVCRAFVRRTRELLFRRTYMNSPRDCDNLAALPQSTLLCIKSLRRLSGTIYGGTEGVLNRPSFSILMERLGPLRLTFGQFSWSALGDDARRALSAHSFHRISLAYSSFSSMLDLCTFLRSSAQLEALILDNVHVVDTSIPPSHVHLPHQQGPSVLYLTLQGRYQEPSILNTLVTTRTCPISTDRLRFLSVSISTAEELGSLQRLLESCNTLEKLKVSHFFYDSHNGPLPVPRLKFKSICRLSIEMWDFHSWRRPVVYRALFEWWLAVFEAGGATAMQELSLHTFEPSGSSYDTIIWSSIATALSRTSWEALLELYIEINVEASWSGQRYQSAIQSAVAHLKRSSLNVWVNVEHSDFIEPEPEPDDESDPQEELEDEDDDFSEIEGW